MDIAISIIYLFSRKIRCYPNLPEVDAITNAAYVNM